MKLPISLLTAALCLTLAACGDRTPDATAGTASTDTAVGQKIRDKMEAARSKMATENISISNDGTPKAEITPTGELLINGVAVTTNEEQRKLLLAYRAQIVEIAGAGMDIGVEGANFGMRAASEAIKGVFSGNPEEVEAKIKSEAEKIKAEARKLCALVPPLRELQQALAQSLPEFAPYARSTPMEIDECLTNGGITVP